jgi:hypothetical protein
MDLLLGVLLAVTLLPPAVLPAPDCGILLLLLAALLKLAGRPSCTCMG